MTAKEFREKEGFDFRNNELVEKFADEFARIKWDEAQEAMRGRILDQFFYPYNGLEGKTSQIKEIVKSAPLAEYQ